MQIVFLERYTFNDVFKTKNWARIDPLLRGKKKKDLTMSSDTISPFIFWNLSFKIKIYYVDILLLHI